jgi:glycerol-3-phosphate dehydrogenase (NAD(P)+)
VRSADSEAAFNSNGKMTDKRRTAVLGAGSWGLTVARLLDGNGHDVSLWEFEEGSSEFIKRTRRLPDRLPGVSLPTSVRVTNDLAASLDDASLVAIVTPSHVVRDVARKMRDLMPEDAVVVSLAKGVEEKTLRRMTEVISEEAPDCADRLAALSGPSHAEEVARDQATAVVVASEDEEVARTVQDAFFRPAFRVYTSPDVIGVELGGALKNIIAIAAGMIDGLNLGDNTRGALISRGLAEMTRLALKLGARFETLSGLAGMGDLITTCISRHSRNRHVGEQIGRGKTLDVVLSEMAEVAEGVRTTRSGVALAKRERVEMPIATQVERVLYESIDPKLALAELLSRDPKPEQW